MSARKVSTRSMNTPGTGSKNTNIKSKPATPKLSLNTTSISGSSTNLRANTTINIAGPLLPETIAVDWSSQCVLMHSQYLQALASRHTTQEAITRYEEDIDDQLSQQAEILNRSLCHQTKVEGQVKDLEIQMDIAELSVKLEHTCKEVNDVLKDYNVKVNLDNCITSAESVCNRLYLENIKPFDTQDDYDKFSAVIQRLADTTSKLRMVIGNTEAAQVLGDGVRKFVHLHEEFVRKRKMVGELQNHVNFTMYRMLSDRFADIQGYDKE